ncbi:Poly(A) polymeras-like protein [Polyplosphaeria fusca]|uniref:Poly(A) polymerase n=1 Tax=Polyplosphaeria fusca TaxID=682080 RepID=A0A9P4RD02_9PLEO|nr:Poly(A) polymeras-like protein [Polyplosphaeria fusca]
MAAEKRQWGVTNAISEAAPTELDLKLNDGLIDELKRRNNFESPEGIENRHKVLKHFQKVVEEFVRRICKAKKLPASTVEAAGGKIYAFGSFALGVSNPGSDIDTVVVAPKDVQRSDFFAHFPSIFRELSKAEDIDELVSVPDAFMPIIKMEYSGVSIDLLFVSLPQSSIPADFDLSDKNVMRGLDDVDMRAVNGTRLKDELLSLVPQVKSFRHATRAIKLWSTRRGMYGNVFGYPGGVAWAIMVARICQLYPFACGATIVAKFFRLMLEWSWPRPIMLQAIEEGQFGLKVWNPTIYNIDRGHLMPIITPAFPSMCATHTITTSSKSIMLAEFKRAHQVVSDIQDGKKQWADLFARHTFFSKDHKYYLSIVAACRTKPAYDAFSGLVQSRVRTLAKGIDDSDAGVELARVYTEKMERMHRCENEDQVEMVKKGDMAYKINQEEAKQAEASKGDAEGKPLIIRTATWYIGLTIPEDGAKSLDISFPTAEFKRFVTGTDQYNEDTMSLHVALTRNYELPPDVFEPGETRPAKPVKNKKKKPAAKAEKHTAVKGADKRTSTKAGFDVRILSLLSLDNRFLRNWKAYITMLTCAHTFRAAPSIPPSATSLPAPMESLWLLWPE